LTLTDFKGLRKKPFFICAVLDKTAMLADVLRASRILAVTAATNGYSQLLLIQALAILSFTKTLTGTGFAT
jgi:hypothetical protein